MSFSALITLASAGADTGPFNLYSDIDSYATAFETSVPKANLLAGYTSSLVPNDTLTIRVKSANPVCPNYVDMSFDPAITYHRAFSTAGQFFGSNTLSCVPTSPVAAVWLNDADYSTFNSNGGLLAAGMVIHSDSSGTIATYSRIYDPLALTIYNVSSGIIGSVYEYC